ncbi:MAG: hypothetical protein NTW19_18800 [Planctomycetota bacterium]|nr:hypothetical protein [Planctomycetota bacterium]
MPTTRRSQIERMAAAADKAIKLCAESTLPQVKADERRAKLLVMLVGIVARSAKELANKGEAPCSERPWEHIALWTSDHYYAWDYILKWKPPKGDERSLAHLKMLRAVHLEFAWDCVKSDCPDLLRSLREELTEQVP